MKKYRWVVNCLCGVIASIVLLLFLASLGKGIFRPESPRLRLAREEATINRLFFSLVFTQTLYVVGSSVILCSMLIFVTGHAFAKIHKASVHQAKIGESEIPIAKRDLPQMTPILTKLAAARQMEVVNAGRDEGRKDIIEVYRNVASLHNKNYQTIKNAIEIPANGQKALPFSTPSFASLIQYHELAPGKPLILGYAEGGEAQYRTIQNLKALAVAGWQGSGKTLSMAYIIASAVLCYDAQVYVVDPHKGHDESLSTKIQPLDQGGLVQVVNPFQTPKLIQSLTSTLDDRLNGTESSSRPILLVIDELARMAKSESFDELIHFLERCTEETRKTNITFIGSSPKWTARHFKGRADIRGCMNSLLIHKTKPSQADLLLEDSQDKKLVKQLEHPGDAILMTDYGDPHIVSMPLCSFHDMETVVKKVGNGPPIIVDSHIDIKPVVNDSLTTSVNVDKPTIEGEKENIDFFCQRVRKHIKTHYESTSKFCQQHKIDSGLLSNVLRQKRNMSTKLREQLQRILIS